jgi:hypothetical protein
MSNDETTMIAAFTAAGHSPRTRLEEMMAEAIAIHGGNADKAIEAFIKALLTNDDALTLLWELVLQVRMTAIKHLYTRTLNNARWQSTVAATRSETSSGGDESGQAGSDAQGQFAASPPPGAPPTSKRMESNSTMSAARPSPSPRQSAPPSLKKGPLPAVPTPRQQPRPTPPPTAVLSAASTAYKAAYDREWINGKAIADMTRDEAAGVMRRGGRLAKWIELLISQIPEGDKRRIRELIAPDESDRYFQMADQQTAA